MDVLKIVPTDNSPMVLLDPHVLQFEISGESRPENAGKFYNNVISWLDLFHKNATWKKNDKVAALPLTINFKLDYFNSTSAKYLLDILKLIHNIKESGCVLNINWYYDEMDEDMKESGEEFSQLIEVPFQFISR